MANTVNSLIRRRRELSRDIETLQRDLAAVDHVLRMFSPGMEPDTLAALTNNKPADSAKPGEMARLLLDALRLAGRPLGSGDLTRFVMVARGAEDFHRQRLRVYKALDKLRTRGLVEGVEDSGRLLWEIVR